MNQLEYKVDNIVSSVLNLEIDVLLQGCNCFCGFGRGLAEEILERIPDAYEKADKLTEKGDKNKLGTYSSIQLPNSGHVVNGYTQYHWIKRLNNEPKVKKQKGKRRGFILADYNAIRKIMATLAVEFKGLHIGMPKIGAGWANGDWLIIEQIIKEELILRGVKVTIFVLNESDIPKSLS